MTVMDPLVALNRQRAAEEKRGRSAGYVTTSDGRAFALRKVAQS
ncbi:hypothetical protein ACQR1A_02035 [Bradyrhizobium sp. HKCCYLRH3083]